MAAAAEVLVAAATWGDSGAGLAAAALRAASGAAALPAEALVVALAAAVCTAMPAVADTPGAATVVAMVTGGAVTASASATMALALIGRTMRGGPAATTAIDRHRLISSCKGAARGRLLNPSCGSGSPADADGMRGAACRDGACLPLNVRKINPNPQPPYPPRGSNENEAPCSDSRSSHWNVIPGFGRRPAAGKVTAATLFAPAGRHHGLNSIETFQIMVRGPREELGVGKL